MANKPPTYGDPSQVGSPAAAHVAPGQDYYGSSQYNQPMQPYYQGNGTPQLQPQIPEGGFGPYGGGPPQGNGYYAPPGPMGYQQQPPYGGGYGPGYGPGYGGGGYYDNRGYGGGYGGGGGSSGFMEAMLASLACCCCLDVCCLF